MAGRRDRWIALLLFVQTAALLLAGAAFIGIVVSQAGALDRLNRDVDRLNERLDMADVWQRTHRHPIAGEQPEQPDQEEIDQ